ncbi:methyl-accepting chemotaxis protein [Pseudoalteromonas sp. T1lg65]|uniref:methyl-accepting chemotaxis protein n=1 Tax=Pseudoalteromonas sp. T1lg65 TaxID=2077101 RepID=UPI003F79DCB0
MLSKLTIKQKITMGFSALGILLLLACVLAYVAFSQIKSANQQMSDVTLPIQRSADALQLQQLRLSKLISQAYSFEQGAEVSQATKKFTKEIEQYHLLKSQLKERTKNSPQMQQPLNEAIKLGEQLSTVANSMLEAKSKAINLESDIQRLYQQLLQHKQQASDAMLNLELLETDNARQLEEMVGTGIRIDDMLYTLETNSQRIASLSLDLLEPHQQDVTFLLGNVETNFTFLQRQSQGIDAEALLQEFTSAMRKIKEKLQQPGTLYQAVREQRNQQKNAVQHYQRAEQLSEAVLAELDKIQQNANRAFAESQQHSESLIDSAQNLAVVMVGVFLLLAMFISYSTSKAMLGPLAAVNKMLKYLATGDLSRRMTKRNDDEFGQLIDNLNQVKENLSALLVDINSQVVELQTLSTSSLSESQQIAKNATEQMQRMDNANRLSHNIAASAVSVSERSTDSLDSIHNANQQRQHVANYTAENERLIMSLSQRMSEAVVSMAKLTSHSENIGGILDTISSIAEQTNLLALNAAIEAARAGEQGRGFAVVADEVRTLASRTQDSTNEINSMIASLRQDTKQASEAIDLGQKDVQLCVKQSEALMQSMAEISSALEQVTQLSEEVNQAANGQARDCKSIESVMLEAQATAGENADAMNNMAKGSESLRMFADKLAKLVERFKL